MKNKWIKGLSICLLVGSLWNCASPETEFAPYTSGAYVLNAGNFSDNNGSISYIPFSSTLVSTDIFNKANQRTLTGGLNDYSEVNGKGLITVDNTTAGQDKVEIVEVGTFKSVATLKAPDIENPRQVVPVGVNKAYVSCWDASGDFTNGTFYKDPGYVAVIDLGKNAVTKKIPAVKGAEWMVVVGNEVYLGSRYSEDKTLAVIDATTDEVKQRIELGVNPQPIAVDADSKLWIVSGSELIRLNPQSKAIETRLSFGTEGPSSIALGPDRRTLYYSLAGKTYRFLINEAQLSASPLINRGFGALGVDPQSGTIYAGVTPSYKQAGYVLRYQPSGALIDSLKVEIAPSKFYFK